MAGLSQERRDVEALTAGLTRWFRARRHDEGLRLGPFALNKSSGFSSESLLFEVFAGGADKGEGHVLRLPPAGGGLFPEYDLERQAATQELLAAAGVPAPSPSVFEPDESWIGTRFMVMPRIAGRLPGDYVYPVKGWLKDAGEAHQQACYESFVDTMVALHSVDVTEHDVAFLHRPNGVGLTAEIDWWSDYLDWALDGDVGPGSGDPDGQMADAYRWVRETAPDDDHLALGWGDARFANTIYDDAGTVVGALDWEQACLAPPEMDVGFWLATRRQSAEVVGVTTDPELPGFLDRDETLARIETGLGRPLDSIGWHETFAMVRMGTCIVATKALLRRSGQHDHYLLGAPLLPPWTIDAIGPR
jgi:aminoglycoside phosphotransferase (APT) family kinase protein